MRLKCNNVQCLPYPCSDDHEGGRLGRRHDIHVVPSQSQHEFAISGSSAHVPSILGVTINGSVKGIERDREGEKSGLNSTQMKRAKANLIELVKTLCQSKEEN